MHPTEALRLLGGTATRAQLLAVCEVADLRRLVASGDVVRLARGRYALAEADEAVLVAGRLSGHLSHTSAALQHGWAVARPPDRPHVTVRRSRKLTAEQRSLASIHHADLAVDEVRDRVTSLHRTVQDCLRMPMEEAVAVADSVLREQAMRHVDLLHLAAGLRGPGAARARRAAAFADARAANPFESVLRVHAARVRGLRAVPQVGLALPGLFVRPDLVDVDRRIVIEGESHAWHSTRTQLRRDCRRHTLLAVDGWILLRFGWETVMFRGDDVVDLMAQAVDLSDERAQRHRRVS